jgi:hypothetical protein
VRHRKNDSRKPRMDLIPPNAIELVAYLLGRGARKYQEENWRECENPSRYVAALMRHGFKHLGREFTDPDTALPHLASAATNALFALELYLDGKTDKTMVGNYFAVVERISPTSGKIKKRFKSYTRAWAHFENEELDFDVYTIKTVSVHEKTGEITSLPRKKKKRKISLAA